MARWSSHFSDAKYSGLVSSLNVWSRRSERRDACQLGDAYWYVVPVAVGVVASEDLLSLSAGLDPLLYVSTSECERLAIDGECQGYFAGGFVCGAASLVIALDVLVLAPVAVLTEQTPKEGIEVATLA